MKIFFLNIFYKICNFYSASPYPAKKITKLPGGGTITSHIQPLVLKEGECICDLVHRGEINSGWCRKHHTDWA